MLKATVIIVLVFCSLIVYAAVCAAAAADKRQDRIRRWHLIDTFRFHGEYQTYRCPLCDAVARVTTTAANGWTFACTECDLSVTTWMPEELTAAVQAECWMRLGMPLDTGSTTGI